MAVVIAAITFALALVQPAPASALVSPAITSVAPNQCYRGETSEMIITGTNFGEAERVSFGDGITVDSFTVDSATQITAIITVDTDAGIGGRIVSVTTPGGTASTPWGRLIVNRPAAALDLVTPNWGNPGETLIVLIEGANLGEAEQVSFGDGITVDSFTVDLTTQITANITISNDAIVGERDI